MQFMQEFSIRMAEVKPWWQATGIQDLWETLEQHVIHFEYTKMYLVTHLAVSTQQICCGDNSITNISEHLHIGNVKKAYQSTKKVNCIQQMLKHNDWCTSLDYMEKTLSYLAIQCWYDIATTIVFNLLSGANKQWNIHRVHISWLQYCQGEPFFRPVSQQVHHLRETYVCAVCRILKLPLLRDVSAVVGDPNFGQLFRTKSADDWGLEVRRLVIECPQTVLIDSIFVKLQNGLLYYHHPFYCPTSVERLGLDCTVQYTNGNQGNMPASYSIWVEYMDSDLDNTFHGRVLSCLVLLFSLAPLNQIL